MTTAVRQVVKLSHERWSAKNGVQVLGQALAGDQSPSPRRASRPTTNPE
jgi:hypothetical protein